MQLWRDDDFKYCLDSEDEGGGEAAEQRVTRIFKAYHEAWEKEAKFKRDVINEAKLLKKYGGLCWNDVDNDDELLYSDKKSLHW